LTGAEAATIWSEFEQLTIEYVHNAAIRRRAWEPAETYGFLTLYDATFLACTELAPADGAVQREYWTADRVLLNTLGNRRPAYVRELGA
jgi:predicted nucleic acid-binding protein